MSLIFSEYKWTILYLVSLAVIVVVCRPRSIHESVPPFFVSQRWSLTDAVVLLALTHIILMGLWGMVSLARGNQNLYTIYTVADVLGAPLIIGVVWLRFGKIRSLLAEMGLFTPEWGRAILRAVPWALAFVTFYLLVMILLPAQQFAEIVREQNPGVENKVGVYVRTWGTGASILITIWVTTTTVFMEEVLFRGLLYSALRKLLGRTNSVLASAFLFTLAHSGIRLGSIGIFLFGCLFAYLYNRTNSLLSPIFLHLVTNLFWDTVTISMAMSSILGA